MTIVSFNKTFAALLLCMNTLQGVSQGVNCPPNIDFEMGDFTNWECRVGVVTSSPGSNMITWAYNGQTFNRHTIIPASSTDVDRLGLFPQSCPNGSGYSIRLGNELSGAEAESVSFTYDIPSSITNFSIIYHYAIVMQDPGHLAEQQPRFKAKVYDANTNTEIDCVSFDFTASASLPGFQLSPVVPQVLFKDWTPITVDLSAFSGKRITLEFSTSDCTLGGHFGYAYVDVSSVCNGTIRGAFQCEGDNYVNMTAPYGFSEYTWYSDNSFSTVIGNYADLLIDPAPPVGSVFPVIVKPFPFFGCPDTLYATIGTAPKPPSIAGPDIANCNKQLTQLGPTPTKGYSYTWTPPIYLNNPSLSNPSIRGVLPGPTTFIVKTIDLATSCFSYDTATITPFFVDTASSITGKMEYCPGETLNNTIRVNNPGVGVQWKLNNFSISGATNQTFQPIESGIYWGQISQNGCVDTTRIYNIRLSPVPNAAFRLNRSVQCLNNPANFINATTIADSEPLTYSWKFGDGALSTDRDPVKSYSSPGNYQVTLIASTAAGCSDTTQGNIVIMKDCGVLMPTAFTPNSDGLNDIIRPNLSGVKGLKRFTIYNRHGQIVFSTAREDHGWDGTLNGTKLESGVFVWIVEYYSDDDIVLVQKGTLTLIR